MKKIMKTVQSSYLHLFNILLSWVEFLSRIIESSFSIQFKCLSLTSQFNSTLFQKNLNSTWYFSSRVLNSNLNTRLDVISLLMSTIVDVIWNNDTDDSFTTLSAFVLIKMNDYVDFISMLVNNWNVVSIFLKTAMWNNNNNTCSREQFSLILIFVIIIHKSQRLILVKVILNLAILNLCQDLTYVSLSRVHRIQDLAFKISFFYDHFFWCNHVMMSQFSNALIIVIADRDCHHSSFFSQC